MEIQNPNEVREILLGAKAELSKGWIQGNLMNKHGVCLYGGAGKSGTVGTVYFDREQRSFWA